MNAQCPALTLSAWQDLSRGARAVASDLQLGGTLEEAKGRRDLSEWECLMMGVDYHGFHSPWNKKASTAKSKPLDAWTRGRDGRLQMQVYGHFR